MHCINKRRLEITKHQRLSSLRSNLSKHWVSLGGKQTITYCKMEMYIKYMTPDRLDRGY